MNIIAMRGRSKALVLSDPDTRMGFILDLRTGLPGEPRSVDSILKFGYWSPVGAEREVKHGGPGPHTTGTPQASHGGGRRSGRRVSMDTDPMLLWDGFFEERSISAIAERATKAFTAAIDSGELSGKPLDLTTEALHHLPAFLAVAGQDLADNPDGNDTALRMLREYETLAEAFETNTIRPSHALGLELIIMRSSGVYDDLERLQRFRAADDNGPVDTFYDRNPKAAVELKKQVAAQVIEAWGAGPGPDKAREALLESGARLGADTPDSTAAAFVHTWASTSNDSNPLSLATQDAAERAFTINDAQPWHKPSPTLRTEHADLLEESLVNMHARTQRWFEERDITHVTLYRGQQEYVLADPGERHAADWRVDQLLPGAEMEDGRIVTRKVGIPGSELTIHFMDGTSEDLASDDWVRVMVNPQARFDARSMDLGDMDTVRLRPMSSWSLSPDTAHQFTSSDGSIMTAEVPVERILSTPQTGFGCLSENECVVLGGTLDVEWTYERMGH